MARHRGRRRLLSSRPHAPRCSLNRDPCGVDGFASRARGACGTEARRPPDRAAPLLPTRGRRARIDAHGGGRSPWGPGSFGSDCSDCEITPRPSRFLPSGPFPPSPALPYHRRSSISSWEEEVPGSNSLDLRV